MLGAVLALFDESPVEPLEELFDELLDELLAELLLDESFDELADELLFAVFELLELFELPELPELLELLLLAVVADSTCVLSSDVPADVVPCSTVVFPSASVVISVCVGVVVLFLYELLAIAIVAPTTIKAPIITAIIIFVFLLVCSAGAFSTLLSSFYSSKSQI